MVLNLQDKFYGTVKDELRNVTLVSVHPETPDVTLTVSNSERRHFSSWQGNRGFARRRTWVRRTSKPED